MSLILLRIHRLNSDITIHAHPLPFTPSLFHDPSTPKSVLKPSFSLILDCTDNPATRHFLNAYAVAYDIPLVSGGAVRTDGTVGVFGLPLDPSLPAASTLPSTSPNVSPSPPARGPCYACIFPPTPPTPASTTSADLSPAEQQLQDDLRAEKQALQGTGACSDEGVVGILCGQVGVQMGAEAMRVMLGIGQLLLGNGDSLLPLSLTTCTDSQANAASSLSSLRLPTSNDQAARSEADLLSVWHIPLARSTCHRVRFHPRLSVALCRALDTVLALERLPRRP